MILLRQVLFLLSKLNLLHRNGQLFALKKQKNVVPPEELRAHIPENKPRSENPDPAARTGFSARIIVLKRPNLRHIL